MERLLLIYKSIHNPILWSIILTSFLKSYWKEASYELLLLILPLVFSDHIFKKLNKSIVTSHFYSLISVWYHLDIKKEVQINLEISKESIIVWVNKGFLRMNKNYFIYSDIKLPKKTTLNQYVRAWKELWNILWKMKNEKEIFYHLTNY